MKPIPQLEWKSLKDQGARYSGDYMIIWSSGSLKWLASYSADEDHPFDSLPEAEDWCQQDFTARLKAAEKWTSQPPVEPGDYFILPPHSLRSAITCGAWQIQQFKERPGYWPKGTLFRKIDEPEEPYDFSNT